MTLPIGFVYDGDVMEDESVTVPSLADFDGFWINRFKISMLVDGGGCSSKSLAVDPSNFRTLYAMNETELESAAAYLEEYSGMLKRLFSVEVGHCFDWKSMERAWSSICDRDNIVFIFAHSDGDWLKLGNNSQLDCLKLTSMLHKNDTNGITLLILNCCLSASGAEGASLLSVVAREGFCGMIGTEAEILNTHALRCGTRLMWEMCARSCTLGEALDSIQQDPKLFPLSLFYSCYANRNFRLIGPITNLLGSQ